jgi:hypothetical protein
MMHPHLPGPLPVAVPDIGFAQNISIGPKPLIHRGLRICPAITVASQRGRSTGSFGCHRHDHGSHFTRNAYGSRRESATRNILTVLLMTVRFAVARIRLRTFQVLPHGRTGAPGGRLTVP